MFHYFISFFTLNALRIDVLLKVTLGVTIIEVHLFYTRTHTHTDTNTHTHIRTLGHTHTHTHTHTRVDAYT